MDQEKAKQATRPQNYFEAAGAQERKIHERRVSVEKRKKEQDDERTQFELYRKGNRTKFTALMNEHPEVRDLVAFLKTMGPASAPALVDYIENLEWLKKAEPDVKIAILSYIGLAIMRLRIQHGLPPFDDGLGPHLTGEPENNAFMLIRKMLTGV